MKKRRNRKIITLSVFEVFFALLFVFLCVWWFGASYPAFNAVARKEAKIPGLSSGLSPQGLCVLPENEAGYDFAMSGYIADMPSRVYLIDEENAEQHYVTFTMNGKPVKTHFGGVTCTKNYMLIASENDIIRIALSDIYATENGGSVEIFDYFSTDIGNAFCYATESELFVGEFYRPGNYETDPSHYIDVNGKTNHAFVYIYDLAETAVGGVETTGPKAAISVPDQVQGIAVTEDKIYLSTSYGLPDSKLYVYENKLNGQPDDTIPLLSEMSSERPLYILEPKAADLTMPCMSEEICVKDGRLYILFESLSNKYKYFVRTRLANIYSIALTDLD